jgi:hypothetical protein
MYKSKPQSTTSSDGSPTNETLPAPPISCRAALGFTHALSDLSRTSEERHRTFRVQAMNCKRRIQHQLAPHMLRARFMNAAAFPRVTCHAAFGRATLRLNIFHTEWPPSAGPMRLALRHPDIHGHPRGPRRLRL